jgi:hypothetical protein
MLKHRMMADEQLPKRIPMRQPWNVLRASLFLICVSTNWNGLVQRWKVEVIRWVRLCLVECRRVEDALPLWWVELVVACTRSSLSDNKRKSSRSASYTLCFLDYSSTPLRRKVSFI